MVNYLKRTWAEINLDALEHNYRQIRGLLKPETRMMCVVKADGYGHGAIPVAQQLAQLGAEWFGVSNLEEALQLREGGIRQPILILGYTPPSKAEVLSQNGISQTVFSLEYAKALSFKAEETGVTVKMHLKVDTGMSRIGFLYHDQQKNQSALDEMMEASRLPALQPEGIFTHFAAADDRQQESFTLKQYELFTSAIAGLKEKGVTFQLCHCCNSAAVMSHPEMHLDMVRPGIILYGNVPSDQMDIPLDLHPAMELKTVISQVKEVEAGSTVSYSRTFETPKPTQVATVSIGYADGYPRSLSSRADMLVAGRRARVIGRVCMDQLMLDVSGNQEVQPGMTVTVFGHDHGAFLPIEEVAGLAGTINYETMCLIGKRVPRIYLRHGEKIEQLNYILPDPTMTLNF